MHWKTWTIALLLIAVSVPAHADHSRPCPEYSRYYPPGAPEHTYPVYVTVDEIVNSYVPVVWIYEESNGEPGLQRHDGYCQFDGVDGTNQDAIIF